MLAVTNGHDGLTHVLSDPVKLGSARKTGFGDRLLAATVFALCLTGLTSPVRAHVVEYEVQKPEGAPDDLWMRSYRTCEIVSRGGAPDAKLVCGYPLGWKLTDRSGKVLFPNEGFIPYPATWAFSTDVGVIDMGPELSVLNLTTWTHVELMFDRLEAVPAALGFELLAWIWTKDRASAVVMNNGQLLQLHTPADFATAEANTDTRCRRIGMIAALDLGNLKNRHWHALRRLPRPQSASGSGTCPAEAREIIAGQDDAGWRWLDPATLLPRDEAVYASPKAILSQAITNP